MNPRGAEHGPEARTLVVPMVTRREMLLGVVAGVAVFALLGAGVAVLFRQMRSLELSGVIVAREFTPRPETQITVGKAGLDARHVAGDYVFTVRVDSVGREFRVWVDQKTFEAHGVGEAFSFPKPVERGAGR